MYHGYEPKKERIWCGGYGCTYIACIDRNSKSDRVIKIGLVNEDEVKNAKRMSQMSLGPKIYDSFRVPIYHIRDHENVKIDDLVEVDDEDYHAIVMEKYDGDLLSIVDNRLKILTKEDGETILNIYNSCGDKLIIQGDLKLANTLYKSEGYKKKIVMTDFLSLEVLSDDRAVSTAFAKTRVLADWLVNLNYYYYYGPDDEEAYTMGFLTSLYEKAYVMFKDNTDIDVMRDKIRELAKEYVKEYNRLPYNQRITLPPAPIISDIYNL
jgi:serine/threonine protein kinase